MAAPVADAEVKKAMEAFRALDAEKQKLMLTRQQFMSQLNENQLVEAELDLLTDETDVYKLIGPVLVKQDLGEVKTNVKNRLNLIKKEVERNENAISDKDKEQEKEDTMQMKRIRRVKEEIKAKAKERVLREDAMSAEASTMSEIAKAERKEKERSEAK